MFIFYRKYYTCKNPYISTNGGGVWIILKLTIKHTTYRIIVIPEDVSWWFRTVSYHAGKIDSTPSIYEKFRSANNFSIWLCKKSKKLVHINRSKRATHLYYSHVTILK